VSNVEPGIGRLEVDVNKSPAACAFDANNRQAALKAKFHDGNSLASDPGDESQGAGSAVSVERLAVVTRLAGLDCWTELIAVLAKSSLAGRVDLKLCATRASAVDEKRHFSLSDMEQPARVAFELFPRGLRLWWPYWWS
jgi:hypothetical protein